MDAPQPPPAPPPPAYVAAAPPTAAPPMAGASTGTTPFAGMGDGLALSTPVYQTIVQTVHSVSVPALDVDTIARQVAAGYREAGQLLGAQLGGGAEGFT